MPATGESTIQIKRRILVGLIILPLFLGFVAFLNILGNPQFQDIRSIDVVLGRRCYRARPADWVEVPQTLARQEPIHGDR